LPEFPTNRSTRNREHAPKIRLHKTRQRDSCSGDRQCPPARKSSRSPNRRVSNGVDSVDSNRSRLKPREGLPTIQNRPGSAARCRAGLIIARTDEPQLWHGTRAVRNRLSAGRRRHGRSIPSSGRAARARRGHQSPARDVGARLRAVAALWIAVTSREWRRRWPQPRLPCWTLLLSCGAGQGDSPQGTQSISNSMIE